jgi:hypothetical protein
MDGDDNKLEAEGNLNLESEMNRSEDDEGNFSVTHQRLDEGSVLMEMEKEEI